jgi:hypothetical protein
MFMQACTPALQQPQAMSQHRQVLQCTKRQLDVEKGLHQLACQEVVLLKERQEHVHQYDAKDDQEVCCARMCCTQQQLQHKGVLLAAASGAFIHTRLCLQRAHDIKRELCLAKMESEQLKLDGLRQRKQNSILRLKLASAKEDAELLQRNRALLDQHSQRLLDEIAGLQGSLATAKQQLTDVSAAKAMLQTDAEKYQVLMQLPHCCRLVKCMYQDKTAQVIHVMHASRLVQQTTSVQRLSTQPLQRCYCCAD